MKRISRRKRHSICTPLFLSLAVALSLPEAAFAQDTASGSATDAKALDVSKKSVRATADAPAADSLAKAVEAITENKLKRHIDFLASDTLQGREAGTHGNYAAGAYIVNQLRKSNVAPVATGEDYFHYFHPNFRNILAIIPGSDEKLKNEFILVGGHYDHVGFGNRTNSRGPFGVVHNGADDNASGTAGVLEIAQSLSGLATKPKRSILVAFWDGEEKGLLGSKHFVDYPAVAMSKIKFHLNADMIGRLRPDGLEISGWQSATGCRQFIARQNSGGIKIRFMYTYKPESDHWPFFERRVPSLMFHTGKHADYHRPSDDTHLLNMQGIRQVTRFMLRCTVAAANAETLPAFRDWSKERADKFASIFSQPPGSEPSRLGVTYNATLAKEGTIRLTSISPRSPADIAGLLPGDDVLAVGDQSTGDSPDFRSLVMSAATESTFRIQRGDTERELPVTLRGNPVLFGMRWTMHNAEPGSAIVTRVDPDSPADAASLKPQHRILAVNGQRFKTRKEFQQLLFDAEGTVKLETELAGNFESHSIELSKQPLDDQAPSETRTKK